MSLHVASLPALPEATARVARVAFKRKGDIYLTIGDRLGTLFDEVDFGCLYAVDGKPALSPNLLALVTIFQFMENLSDREAADAVRSRLDWKYALHLSLEDTGFDDSVLSEFRQRLAKHELAHDLFERVLKQLQQNLIVVVEHGHLERLPWFGLPNSAKAACLGDILTLALNLARFVREATTAQARSPTAGT